MDNILSGTATAGQTGPGSDVNKGVLRIPYSSSITSSVYLVSYTGHSFGEYCPSAETQLGYSTAQTDLASLGESYPSAETQLVYSTDPADWATLGESYPSTEIQLMYSTTPAD